MVGQQRRILDHDQFEQITYRSFDCFGIAAWSIDEVGHDADHLRESCAIAQHRAHTRAKSLVGATHFVEHAATRFDGGLLVAHTREFVGQFALRL